MKHLISALVFALSLNSLAHASLSDPKSEGIAVARVLSLAADSTSEVAKAIAAVQADSTDGRNPNGSIAMPLKCTDLRTLILDGSMEVEAGVTSTRYRVLVSIPTKYNVHHGQEMGTLNFTVEVTQTPEKIETSEVKAFEEKKSPIDGVKVNGVSIYEYSSEGGLHKLNAAGN